MTFHFALALAMVGAFAVPVASAQTCWPDIRRSTPDARFAVNSAQGTVLDKKTGLTWKRCEEGSSGTDCATRTGLGSMIWSQALSHATASTFAGYKDWRLPNVKELESLVEVACDIPAINTTVFPRTPSGPFWTSSPFAHNYLYHAWNVDFYHGYSYPDYSYFSRAVRLVRGGQ